jgi:hypothetical protein
MQMMSVTVLQALREVCQVRTKASGEMRDHTTAVVGDDTQRRMPLQVPGKHKAR